MKNKINATNIEHAIIAIIIQAVFISIFALTNNPFGQWFGATFAIAFFLGREHAQREYKIGDPSKLKGYEALDIWRWSFDAQMDLLLPTVGTLLLAGIISIF